MVVNLSYCTLRLVTNATVVVYSKQDLRDFSNYPPVNLGTLQAYCKNNSKRIRVQLKAEDGFSNGYHHISSSESYYNKLLNVAGEKVCRFSQSNSCVSIIETLSTGNTR